MKNNNNNELVKQMMNLNDILHVCVVVVVLTISVDVSTDNISLELVRLAVAEVLATIGISVTRIKLLVPFCCSADGTENTDPIERHASSIRITLLQTEVCMVNTLHLSIRNTQSLLRFS